MESIPRIGPGQAKCSEKRWNNIVTGKLLAEVSDTSGNIHTVYREVKTNVPSLKKKLWGRFLGRQKEIGKLIEWADNQRYPIAVLYGFGGNGKTTIQQKVGEEFIHGVKCQLRWPYDGAVWVSAVDYSRGQPHLLDVLREIAKTFRLYECHDECCTLANLELIQPHVIRNDVKELLEKERVLVLLDNFETVSKPNQVDILKFFGNLRGSSQTLISTRYRPDWFLEQEQDEMYSMAHVLIRVDGLSSENAETLVQEFLNAKSFPQSDFDAREITQLAEVTRNNPKTILALLGLVEQGLSLTHLLNAITSGASEADRIYDIVIDRAWEEILNEHDKAVLMAKAFFDYSVSDDDLGQVAGVNGDLLKEATKTLATISFFEFERTQQNTLRISIHPLAQDFARRVLRNRTEFEREAEERWWKTYAPGVIQSTRQTAYESLQPELEEDVANVLAHLEKRVYQCSPYCLQAAKMFGEHGGLGHTLFYWGRYDEVLRVAESVLDIGIKQENPLLIGEIALSLISSISIKRHKFDQADRYIGLAIEQNTTLHDRWLEGMIESFRADLYSERGYLRAAEQSCQKALKIFLELGVTHDIAGTYLDLGCLTIDIAAEDLEEAIDTSGKIREKLLTAETHLDNAEAYIDKQAPDCWETQHLMIFHRIHKAIIARLHGDLNLARDLFQSCISRVQSLSGVANLYRELGLVEHLADNKDLAYSYEERGLSLFRQVGMLDTLPPEHSYRMIDRMKQEGMW